MAEQPIGWASPATRTSACEASLAPAETCIDRDTSGRRDDRDGAGRVGEAEDVLRIDQVGRPTIGDDDVLVRVRAAGLDQGFGTLSPVPRRVWQLRA